MAVYHSFDIYFPHFIPWKQMFRPQNCSCFFPVVLVLCCHSVDLIVIWRNDSQLNSFLLFFPVWNLDTSTCIHDTYSFTEQFRCLVGHRGDSYPTPFLIPRPFLIQPISVYSRRHVFICLLQRETPKIFKYNAFMATVMVEVKYYICMVITNSYAAKACIHEYIHTHSYTYVGVPRIHVFKYITRS